MATGQQMLHGDVVGPHPRHQTARMAKAGRRNGGGHQQGPDACPLGAVVYRHRQLLGSVGQGLEHEVANDPAIRDRHQAIAPPVIGRGEPLGLLVGDPSAAAVESRLATIARQLGVEALQLSDISANDAAHPDVVFDHAQIFRAGAHRAECRASRREGPSGLRV